MPMISALEGAQSSLSPPGGELVEAVRNFGRIAAE
jgi:hypothetical protein